jgi:hypothetical protein
MKSDVYKRKVVTRDELPARVLDATLRIKEREGQLRRSTRDIRTRVLDWTEFEGGVFENLLWTATNLSFLCNEFCSLNITFKLK